LEIRYALGFEPHPSEVPTLDVALEEATSEALAEAQADLEAAEIAAAAANELVDRAVAQATEIECACGHALEEHEPVGGVCLVDGCPCITLDTGTDLEDQI